MPLASKAFTVIRESGAFPAFSGSTGQILHDSARTASGKAVSPEGSLRVAAVWIAVSVLADEVASLSMRLIKKEDKARLPQTPRALRALWDEPNPDQTHFGIEATETLSMALWGASYTMLGWTNGGELDLRWPINPSEVTIDRLEDGGIKLYSPRQGELFNRKGKRPEFEYVPLYTLPGKLTPVSPIELAAELCGLSLAYQDTASKLMGRGLNPSAVLTAGEYMADENATALARRLESLHGGPGNSGHVVVLGGPDLKLERMTMSMVDAEFVAQYDKVFSTLMAMWRIPPTVAGMVDKPSTWGTGVAEFSRGLERFTLRPIVQRRQAGHQKYITKWVDEDLQVKYIFDSLLSASPKDRTEIQRSRLLMGATSIERVLAQEDEPPFDDEETVFSQLSMATDDQRVFLQQRQAAEARKAEADAVSSLVKAGIPIKDAWKLFDEELAKLAEEPETEPEPPTDPLPIAQSQTINDPAQSQGNTNE